MKDTHGRVIDYLRISLTDRCNLRCIYCMPAEGIPQLEHAQVLRNEEILKLVRVAADMGVTRVRLTGGEPLVRKGVVDLVRDIVAVPGIKDVSMTTNGIALGKFARDLKEAGLQRVNISLDTLDAESFTRITRGGDMHTVLESIQTALDVGFKPVKINAVAVRSLNQDFLEFAKLSLDRPLHVRFIEYMPVGDSSGSCGCGWGKEDVVSCDEIIEQINAGARAEGLGELISVESAHKPNGGGPARYMQFAGAQGTVGFISPLSRHFCGDCNRLRLTSEGKIRPCLFSDKEYDVRAELRDGTEADVKRVLCDALRIKPDEHHEGDRAGATQVSMNTIGG